MLENVFVLFGCSGIIAVAGRVFFPRIFPNFVKRLQSERPSIRATLILIMTIFLCSAGFGAMEAWLESQTQFDPLSAILGAVYGLPLSLVWLMPGDPDSAG